MTTATLRESTNIKNAPSKASGATPVSSASKSPDTLNNTPITEDQTDNLKRHFQNFKFNENDNYKYKLKAMIRHQGSHTQGHYECYKHKPLFVKDREGNIIKLSPEIKYSAMGSSDVQSSLGTSDTKSKELNTSTEPERRRKFTLTGNRRPSIAPSDEVTNNRPRTYSESSNTSGSDQEFSNGGFRRKLSNFMGKRPSVYQAHTEEANIQEIIQSGLTTPAEILVNDIDSDYFNAPVNSQALMKTLEEQQQLDESTTKEPHKVKMKKIPTLIKSPYWRISDATITEVSRSAVLLETTTVYMLYYERVDRKQIRQRS
jgi:ubiquitin carboxyl-terminal hydrolase 16